MSVGLELHHSLGNEVPTNPHFSRRCGRIFWLSISACNTMGVVALGCVAGFLFIQLQYVTYKLQQIQPQIDELRTEVQNQQQDQIQELTEQVEKQQNFTEYQIAATFTMLTVLITIFHMASHLRNFHEPVVQRKIMTILWLSPIYSVTSLLSLIVPVMEGYLSIVKDFYEAYVVYTFLSFLISVLGRGNRRLVVETLSKHANHLNKPTRFLSCLYFPPPEESDEAKANAVLLECQVLVMQFVLTKPLTSIASFLVLTLRGNGDDTDSSLVGEDNAEEWSFFKSPLFYIAMVNNLSVFLAFTGLLKFYHAVRDDLQWCLPFFKFLTIKGIVFLTFWQGLVISIAVGLNADGTKSDRTESDARTMAVNIQNLLICLEMLAFSIAHWCVFPAEEWEESYLPKQAVRPGIGIKDFARDIRVIMRRGKESVAQSIPQDEAEPSDDVEENRLT